MKTDSEKTVVLECLNENKITWKAYVKTKKSETVVEVSSISCLFEQCRKMSPRGKKHGVNYA